MEVWQKEIVNALLLFLAVVIIGAFTGFFLPLLLLLTLYLLSRQIYQINRFENWIKTGGRGKYPKASGVWEEIYYHVYRIKKNERRRKKKLSKIIDQFRQSTEALPDAAVVLGDNEEIQWINKAARDVLGLQQTDRGQRIPNLIRFPEFIQFLKVKNYNEVVFLPSPVNKRITLEVRIVKYGAGLRLLLAKDVTQVQKIENMRKDFVANVSHELRTPLTVLRGYLETLQDMDEGDSPLLTTSLVQMQGQTDRMQHLVDDLLLLTRLETQQKKAECVDVPRLLNQICTEVDALGHSTNRLKLTLQTDVHIMGNEQELRSAFTNLVNNALKYSPEQSAVKIVWLASEEEVILEVVDEGEGLASTDIPRVTERFYRVEVNRSKKVSGTGLGLAIVKHVLMRHDGHLQITSELGKGSRFSCCFPKKRICT